MSGGILQSDLLYNAATIALIGRASSDAQFEIGMVRRTHDCSRRRWRLLTSKFGRRLTRFTLVSCLTVFAGCSITSKETQLPPLVRAERQLARTEKISFDPQEKAAELLSVARIAADEISDPAATTKTNREEPIRIYNRAAADLAAELPQLAHGQNVLQSLTVQNHLTGEIYRIHLSSFERGEYAASYFQKLIEARKLKALRHEPVAIRGGVGGTLVGVHQSVPLGSPPPAFEPTDGYRVPVTSIIDFGRRRLKEPVDARLRLIDPRRRDAVKIGNERFRLAANFSAPLLAFGRVNELWLGFINMIRGENMRGTPGLLLPEGYDLDHVPVIFVHGLLSSSIFWRNTALALLQDPKIRRRYQFWVYSYPTGNPISDSALRLREDLALAQERFGIKRGIVLIGYSLGGVVCQMQVTNSGRTIWNESFGPRAQELYSQIPNDSRVRRSLIFQADPAVSRVIFVATPHRGTSLVQGWIGAITIWLIRLPSNLLDEIPEALARAFNSRGQRAEVPRTLLPTSIEELSPKSPLLRALDQLPIRAPHHSIIGDRGRGDSPNSSDGIVPYSSTHLASAESEKIVPTGHQPLVDPRSVEEIRRILLLNLRILDHQRQLQE
jgi:pimeloyl-ACP methyl ester carboxylesterase